MRKWGLGLISIFALNYSVFSYAEDDRTQLPRIFKHSYIGLEIGYMKVNMSNSNLLPGFIAQTIRNQGATYHISLGHYFNPYIALEINGYWMYPKIFFINVNNFAFHSSIALTGFGVFAKPTLPITENLSAFGLVGAGFISKGALIFNGVDILGRAVVPTEYVGAGWNYELSKHWGLEGSGVYGLAQPSKRSPSFYNIALGIHFKFAS